MLRVAVSGAVTAVAASYSFEELVENVNSAQTTWTAAKPSRFGSPDERATPDTKISSKRKNHRNLVQKASPTTSMYALHSQSARMLQDMSEINRRAAVAGHLAQRKLSTIDAASPLATRRCCPQKIHSRTADF